MSVENTIILLHYIKKYSTDLNTKERVLTLRSNNVQLINLPIIEEIRNATSDEYSDKARIYLYILGLHHSTCSKQDCACVTKFDNEKNTFRQFCSIQCRNKDSEMRKQISSTWTDEKKKIKNEKSKATNLEKYGVENIQQLESTKLKTKATNLEKYGYDHTAQVPEFIKKKHDTFMDKYNTIYPSQLDEVKKRTAENNIIKYGYPNIKYKNIPNWKDLNKEFIEENFIQNKVINFEQLEKYFDLCSGASYKILKRLDVDYDKSCSQQELEIKQLLQVNDINFMHHDRKVLDKTELDFYCPDQKLAIEFNGIYWHSYGKEERNVNKQQGNLYFQKYRHINKTNECNEQGVQVLQIFEDEYKHKKDIWNSVILSHLQKSPNKIGARKCTIKEVPNKEALEFLDANHLQGHGNSSAHSIRIGAYYNDELVSLMTFGQARYSKDIEVDYELIRFCSKLFTNIPGIGSRLLKYFEKNYNPKGLVSYANRRWSNGNIYQNLGFQEIKQRYQPNYFYFLFPENILKSRVQFQKHKLKDKLELFDENLTELENMINNEYRVIYDSGNCSYIKYYK